MEKMCNIAHKEREKNDKYSNEIGITVSNNIGKLYERLVMEGMKKNVIIGLNEHQVGGKKGSRMAHILMQKEAALEEKIPHYNPRCN